MRALKESSAIGVAAGAPMLLRRGQVGDAGEGGRIAYDAVQAVATQHGFPSDLPSSEAATRMFSRVVARSDVHAVVAERDGQVVGSNFLWEGDPIAGAGPVTVDPAMQNSSMGRRLMQAVLARAAERKFAGVRLVQAAYNSRAVALYSKLGFVVREPLSLMQGPVPEVTRADRLVRLATISDLNTCIPMAERLLGHPRGKELEAAIAQRDARVVEHNGRVTGYTTGVGYYGHTVGEANDDVQALIGAASGISGPGLLVPTRNASLLRWCLMHGLAIVQPMMLMTSGEYSDPSGVWLPSFLY
jgi:ribosomal protein S18 acetylase RimI-like enzyme